MEPRFIIYIVYMSKTWETHVLVKYVEFMPLVRGTGECMFTTIYGFLNKMHLDLHKFLAIVMDGVVSMTG